VIKLCAACNSTWAGGRFCEDCGGPLTDPYAEDAGERMERSIWGYIRLQYGARRGMIVRVMANLLGPLVFGLLAREAFLLDGAWLGVGIAGAAVAGFVTWASIYWFAGKAVRIWVLRKGQLHKRRMAKALLRRVTTSRSATP
jgi:hypothetical protein